MTQLLNLDPYSVPCTSFKVLRPFKYTTDGKLITVWLGKMPICKSVEYSITFNESEEGFIYTADEFPVNTEPKFLEPNSKGELYNLVLINPKFCDPCSVGYVMPTNEMCVEFGQLGALVYANLDQLFINANLLGGRFIKYLAYFVKAFIKQRMRKGDKDILELTKYLKTLRQQSTKHYPFDHYLKKAGNSWTRPLVVMEILQKEFPFELTAIIGTPLLCQIPS